MIFYMNRKGFFLIFCHILIKKNCQRHNEPLKDLFLRVLGCYDFWSWRDCWFAASGWQRWSGGFTENHDDKNLAEAPMSFEFWRDYQMMRIRCRLQVPSLPPFIPITYPTGLMWAPNGEEVNLWQNWEKNSRRKESCPLYHLLQVSQSREQVSTASVAIIQVPIYHGGNDTNWWQLYRYVPIYQGGIDTHWLAIISIGGNI